MTLREVLKARMAEVFGKATWTELAEQTELPYRYILRWTNETKPQRPRLAHTQVLERALDLPPGFLYAFSHEYAQQERRRQSGPSTLAQIQLRLDGLSHVQALLGAGVQRLLAEAGLPDAVPELRRIAESPGQVVELFQRTDNPRGGRIG